MNKIKTSIDQIKPRLVAHVNAVLKDLIDVVSQDAKTNIDRGDYEDAAEMLKDIARHKEDAEQLIAMIEGSRFANTIIHNIEDNNDWFGVYFMEDTLELISIMFDTQFEVDH
jgi:putative methionine-R-sulfoxide reductase with GAF domain